MLCTKCGQDKIETEFYKQKNHKGEIIISTPCKECRKKSAAEYRKAHPWQKKPKKPRIQGFRKLPEDQRKCSKCQGIKHKDCFFRDSNRASGVSSYCKECFMEMKKKRREERGVEFLEVRRAYREANLEKIQEQDRISRARNKEKRNAAERKRQKILKSLPNTLTDEQTKEIHQHFNGRCAFCDKQAEHLDHFVPIATECVGTTKENMIPICESMNKSKRDYNPFYWAKTCLYPKEQEKFNETVKYLANLNNMCVSEYEKYVENCFKK